MSSPKLSSDINMYSYMHTLNKLFYFILICVFMYVCLSVEKNNKDPCNCTLMARDRNSHHFCVDSKMYKCWLRF